MKAEIAGTIGTDKKARRRLTLTDRIAALDGKIGRARAQLEKFKAERDRLQREAIAKAEADLAAAKAIV